MTIDDPRARVPSISRLLEAPTTRQLVDRHGHGPVVAALRSVVTTARESAARGDRVPDVDELVAATGAALRERTGRGTRGVVNATGVVLHTNLGRAPLSAAAVAALHEAAGPSTVEFDLASRERASRGRLAAAQLAALAGAEDALVVNNGAAALVLALAALAGDEQVVVSRGELVEIGGSFRLPEIVEAAGVGLVEVGTTNRTRADDYLRAVEQHPDARVLLRVHPSNFTVAGFASRPAAAELAEVARRTGTTFVHDVGSGLLHDDLPLPPGAQEPSVRTALVDGADVVVASGDKLLGGPQGGLLAGRADPVAACRRHPLARALRVDKLRLAALEATLGAYERDAVATLPAWSALTATREDLAGRARAIVEALAGDGAGVHVGELEGRVGGGTLPGLALPSAGLVLPGHAEEVADRLAAASPPVVGRIHGGRLALDLRTVPPDEDPRLVAALREVLG